MTNAPRQQSGFAAAGDSLTGACVSPDSDGILVFPAVSDAIVVFSRVTAAVFRALPGRDSVVRAAWIRVEAQTRCAADTVHAGSHAVS